MKLTLSERAFPTMRRPGQYVLNFTRRNDWQWNSLNIHVWGAAFAAKKYIELVLRDDEWMWTCLPNGDESSDELVSESGVRIQTSASARPGILREVMEYEYADSEVLWDLPEPYPTMAINWRNRRHWEGAPVGPYQPRRRGSGMRASRTGLVPVQDIATALGVTPRDARGALRRMKAEKPACGWAWPADKVDEVKASIARALGKSV